LNIEDELLENSQIPNFTQIVPVGAAFIVRTDGQ